MPKKATTSKKSDVTKVTITAPPAGVFMLPYNVGQTVDVDSKIADEMMDLGYAKPAK